MIKYVIFNFINCKNVANFEHKLKYDHFSSKNSSSSSSWSNDASLFQVFVHLD